MRKAKWIGALIVAVLVAYAAQAVLTTVDMKIYPDRDEHEFYYKMAERYNTAVSDIALMNAKVNELTVTVNALSVRVNLEHATAIKADVEKLEAYPE